MAKAFVSFCPVVRANYVTSASIATEAITLSTSNQQTASISGNTHPMVAVITNDGSGHYFAIGPSADATATATREWCPPNAVIYKAVNAGDKVAAAIP